MEKGFDPEENTISLFFVESPDFFHGSPDFPLPGVGRSVVKCSHMPCCGYFIEINVPHFVKTKLHVWPSLYVQLKRSRKAYC